MSKPIAIFYHCVFMDSEAQPWLHAPQVVRDQMSHMRDSGLLHNTRMMFTGINGGMESAEIADALLPAMAVKVLHGIQCKNELRTLRLLEEWLPHNPGWNVLYVHAKGSTNTNEMNTRWRNCMMRNLVSRWRECVAMMDSGIESVGCHWMMPPQTPPGQNIWGGNCWWATSDYLSTLPSLMETQRVKMSGIDSLDSRYEAEVWIGNGPRLPKVRDMHPNGLWQCP